MGRVDIMMTGRRRSRWGYVVFALAVFGLLWLARGALYRRTQPPPPASIPATVGDAVEKAYNGLGGSFRERVPLADFAAMFHRMADPDANGQLPEIRQASVTDATGPEHPVARFRVQYPNGAAKAEYHFARIDGLWQLQSFTRVPSELEGPLKRVGPPHAAEGGKGAPPTKAVEGGTTQPPAPAGGRPATPCDYVIQPGDTLGGISAQFYGTARHWRRILEANPGLTERSLRVGRKIRIPSNPEPAPPREDATDAPKAAPSTP